ncbi:hypothetical protein EYR40_006108 [Pleurotus pulmonarius]|nr:hypothetical protein EYR36_010727 [Pleurotus pulmonarius]KAF4567113.1 hypothetical protein EYR36_010729 [Pleurotus pulmonarius]KAF4599018.1 hypothetical protein EYR40_006106 [Pleurotus pulmonarius]KAF4599020.1 hypothetical protein EYR40_006108 [Pleurotus pulmonarius]
MLTIAYHLQPRGMKKLPFELLVEIFNLASTRHFLYEERTVPPAYTLIELSHVCRTWRAAIRGAPQLWTIVCGIEPPAMIREIIELSRKMPLLILRVEEDSDDEDTEDDGQEHRDEDKYETEEWEGTEDSSDDNSAEEWHGTEWREGGEGADGLQDAEDHSESSDGEGDHGRDSDADNGSDSSDDSGDDDETFQVTPRGAAVVLLAQLHRIAALHISFNSEDAPTLLPLLDADAPLLQRINLEIVGGDAPIVVNPFRGTAPPQLSTVSLMGGCELSHISSVWANLTHFYLYGEPDTAQEPYQADGGFVRLSSVLSQTSSLADLDIFGAIPPDICDFEVTEIPAIDLPRLTSLTIGGFASKCVLFLAALKCQLDTLTVVAGEDDDHEEYERYEAQYYYLFYMCQQKMASAFERNPVSHIALKKKRDEFSVKGFRSQEGTVESAVETPLTIKILHTQPSFVDEELVSRAINIIPSRQPPKLGVELKNIDGLNLSLVAWDLHTLEGIPCTAINLYGHEARWWGSLDLSTTGDGGNLEGKDQNTR